MKEEKVRVREFPKPRIVLLPVFMEVIILSAVFGSNMPLWACILLGIFNGALVYYLFVVLKIHLLIADRLKKEDSREKDAHRDAAMYAKEIASEGIVLLKNESSLLPFGEGTHINLFGLRSVQMNYNGGGSASSDESGCVKLEEALRQNGFLLNQDLLNLNYNYLKSGSASIAPLKKSHKVKSANSQKGGAEFVAKPGNPVKQEIPAKILRSRDLYPDHRSILEHAKKFSDIAMIVLSRGGGEGYDLDPADLRPIDSERELVEEVCRQFDKVILILNTVNTMEMGWLSEYPSVKSVLWIGFPGTSGNLALAEILKGACTPSGRLPDLWAADNLSTPAANNFCELQEDGTWSKESFHYRNTPEKKGYFIHYSEGIYVGYRYYETRSETDPDFDYDREVVWSFGYGLSYTTFTQKIRSLRETKKELILTVDVKNAGSMQGKEVVQVYVTAPYTGRIEKSAVRLAGFGKTDRLDPGGSETAEIPVSKYEIASFDEKSGRWILEAGKYTISIRADSHHILDSVVWDLSEDVVFEGTSALFADAHTDSLTREFAPGHRAFTGPKDEDYTAPGDVTEALRFVLPTDEELGIRREDIPVLGKYAGIRFSDLIGVPKEDERWEKFVRQMTLPELCHLCGNGAWQTSPVHRLGVPRTISPDGSTCVASTVFSALVMRKAKSGVTWPCPPVLAATFNTKMADLEGTGVGCEAKAMGYDGWYAPSMNCHRTAFNSRNFEYYSEDGFLSGKIAAHVVKNVQDHKVNVFIKHFALNERETNARDQLFTWCGEQAMREIYFKPFELAVREGGSRGRDELLKLYRSYLGWWEPCPSDGAP